MLAILLCIYFGYQISVLAKKKNQNAALWITITIFAFFAAITFATLFLVMFFYKGNIQNQQELLKFAENPIREIFVLFSGFGGYLLIRYILERKPNINKKKND